MTDYNKYRNVSLTRETYSNLEKIAKKLLPNTNLSISKTIESLVNEKKINLTKKQNGKMKLIASKAMLKRLKDLK